MLAKIWKKIGMLILIIACIFNIMTKIVSRVSFDKEIESTAVYYNKVKAEEDAKKANEPDDTIKLDFNLNTLKTDFNTVFEN